MTIANIWNHVISWSWGDMATWAGVVLTWHLARKAQTSATDAKQIRDEIRGEIAKRNAHSELSGLYNLVTKAIEKMDKYGPGAGPNSRRGSRPDEDAATVRELTTQLAVHRAMILKAFSDIEQVHDRLTELLKEFAASNSDAEKVLKGEAIHSELTMLGGNIKKALDGSIYG